MPSLFHPNIFQCKSGIALQAIDLVKHFSTGSSGVLGRATNIVQAVDGVSFTLPTGKTLGIVGESGCGKSTLLRLVTGLRRPTRGGIFLQGLPVEGPRSDVGIVFQSPVLYPWRNILENVLLPIQVLNLPVRRYQDRAHALLELVGLGGFAKHYPSELSGGMQQRVAIARALALNPKLIVADESVSALDVSVQAQVLNLMMELQADLGLSFLFISHDMAVVERVSHDVAVMYLGRIVEIGPRASVFENPQHPYTKALMKAVPIADPRLRKSEKDLNFKPIPSPIRPVGFKAEPSVYREVGPDHRVLVTDSGY